MRIVDARSGKKLQVGEHVYYGPHTEADSYTLLGLRDYVFAARAQLRYDDGHFADWHPVPVRFLHPLFPLERVIVIPT